MKGRYIRMKIFSFMNQKGGVGKSASVATIGAILSDVFNKRTLLIDVDPQGNTSNQFSKVDYYSLFRSILSGRKIGEELSIEDFFIDSSLDIRDGIIHTKYKNLDIIPTYQTLAEVEERLKADVRTPQQFRLKHHLDKLQEEYDFCLIDCSPSINLLNINALVASDEVFIPTKSDGNSLVGIAISLNLIRTVQSYNPGLEIGGCFFTQCDPRTNVMKRTREFLDEELPGLRLPYEIGKTVKLEENSYQQETLLALDKKQKLGVTQAYVALTEYIQSNDREACEKKYLKKLEKQQKMKK